MTDRSWIRKVFFKSFLGLGGKKKRNKKNNHVPLQLDLLESRELPAMLSIANGSLTYLANTDLNNDINVSYNSSNNLPTLNDSEKSITSTNLASPGNNNFNFSTLTILSPEVASQVPIEEYAGSQVLTLDSSLNVVNQITDFLGSQKPASIGLLRIIGHGSDGTLLLGNQLLNQQTLDQQSSQISDWKKAFTPDADILLYGCSVASTARGQSFVNNLAELTGTEVAASINLTGSTTIGGDLVLEFATGKIEADSTNFTRAWNQSGLILAAPVFSSAPTATFTNTLAGSFPVTATGSPTYSIAQQTFFDTNFSTLPNNWTLSGDAAISNGACVLNPAGTIKMAP